MSDKFASGKNAIAECDVCGFRFKLKKLRALVVKTKKTSILACPACWVPDQPQLMLGTFPVADAQAIRDPRPDRSYVQSGLLPDGENALGSRIIEWGWAPVGGARASVDGLTPNSLLFNVVVGDVTVSV